jgi:hypothetical protein
MSAQYQSLINRFVTDSAADSGKTTNVFAAIPQYTKGSVHLHYLLHAGTPLTDTDPFPANGCTPDSGAIWSDGHGYSKCITNSQLLSEAASFTSGHGLPHSDLAHLYVFYLPEGVETCFTSTNGAGGGTCSINAAPGFCGYHAYAAPPLVADMNYAVVDSPTGWTCSSDAGSNTGGNQSPDGNIAADSEISMTSHEVTETVTDPEGTAWQDSAGNEIGDDCAYIYGDSQSFQGTSGALYNQKINGHAYFIQEELSNQDFKTNSTYACIQGEDTVKISPTSGMPSTAVALSGSGYASLETLTVRYKTGLPSPSSVLLCTVKTTKLGTFNCSASIPAAAQAGAIGSHTITAAGSTSHRASTATFHLT